MRFAALDDCCIDKTCAVDRLRERQTATLRVVLMVNAAMFVVELVSGWLAGSVALLADSLDMLGDALVYGFSLYVVARGPLWKARAAVAKAAVMALFGVLVFGQLVYKLLDPQLPTVETMGGVGALALAANGGSGGVDDVFSLAGHRGWHAHLRPVPSLGVPRCS